MSDDVDPFVGEQIKTELAGHGHILSYGAAMRTIRLATAEDCEAIGAAQARAFFDDPLQRWAIFDETTRLALLSEMFALLTRVVSIPLGHVYVDSDLHGAAMWVPPGRWGEPLSRDARATLQVLDRRLDRESTRRFALANDAMHAVHPSEPHWYLQGLGTDPAAQRQGVANAVLAPVLAVADREMIPCYLESTREENVALYQRHGFTVMGSIPIAEDGPTLIAMWRAPLQSG